MKTNAHIRIAYLFLLDSRKKEDHSNEVKKLNSEKLERDDRIMEQSKEVRFEIFGLFYLSFVALTQHHLFSFHFTDH